MLDTQAAMAAWSLIALEGDEPEVRHVVPNFDVRPHRLGVDCECRPSVEYVAADVLLVWHQAWDGREAFEERFTGNGGSLS